MSATDVPPPGPANDPEPVPPREPDLSECCGNGCEPCIFDVYAMDRQRYLAELKAWQDRQRGEASPCAACGR